MLPPSQIYIKIFIHTGDTPLGRQLSKRKKKSEVSSSPQHRPDGRKSPVDNIDSRDEKHKEKSQRARLMKSGSLDDQAVGREKDLPSDLLFKRSGSLKGRTRRESKDRGPNEHRKHRGERESHKNNPKDSPTKQNDYKSRGTRKHDKGDLSSVNLNSTGKNIIFAAV